VEPDRPDLGIPGLTDARVLGAGGFGTVYAAQEPEFGRAVAVKVLRDRVDDDAVRRAFLRECQAMGALSGHPHIVTVHRAGTTDRGRPYIVMDLMSGGSLAERISTAPVPWPELLDIGVLLAGALETAHRRDILHLDLKPANILVSRYGEPKLGDFGISRLPGVAETSGGVRVSPAYAAPERLADGATGVRTDLYGLGATLFALATGTPAFSRTGPEDLLVMLARIAAQPVPDLRPQGVPDPVCRVIEALMAKAPADRFARAADAAVALQDAQRATGQPVTRAVIEGAPTVTEEAAAPTSVALGAVSGSARAGSSPTAAPETAVAHPSLPPVAPSWPRAGVEPDGARSHPWPPPAATYVPPRGAPPQRAPAPRRGTGGLVVGITAAALVAALTVGAIVVSGPRGIGSTPVPPSTSAATTPATTAPATNPPTTAAPGGSVVTVAAGVSHPETGSVLSTLQAYVDSVNDARYTDTFALFSPDSRTAGNGVGAWLEVQRPRQVTDPTITAVRDGDGGSLDVVWTFVSTQAPEDGPGGDQACTDWEIAYEMAGPGPERLIRTSDVLASRAC
jgi:serine/threonine-protein kinase PknK